MIELILSKNCYDKYTDTESVKLILKFLIKNNVKEKKIIKQLFNIYRMEYIDNLCKRCFVPTLFAKSN